jgi:hypothetical protein
LLLDNAMRVTAAAPTHGADLAQFVAAWFADSFEKFLACQRRRHNKRLASCPKGDAVRALLKTASDSRLRRALSASGVSTRQLARWLEHHDTMTDISYGQVSLFLQHLEDRPATGRGRWRRRRRAVEPPAARVDEDPS